MMRDMGKFSQLCMLIAAVAILGLTIFMSVTGNAAAGLQAIVFFATALIMWLLLQAQLKQPKDKEGVIRKIMLYGALFVVSLAVAFWMLLS